MHTSVSELQCRGLAGEGAGHPPAINGTEGGSNVEKGSMWEGKKILSHEATHGKCGRRLREASLFILGNAGR